MKKVFLVVILTFLLVMTFSCKEEENISINLYDYDETVLSAKKISFQANARLLDLLKDNFKVVMQSSQYGEYLVSIEGSLVDPNYYLAIYKNDKYSDVGVSEIVVKDNDVFDFKVECFNEDFDEVDKAIDKVLYTFLKDKNNYFTDNYIDYHLSSAISMMIKNGYTKKYFNFDFDKRHDIVNYMQGPTLALSTASDIFKAVAQARALDLKIPSIDLAVESFNTDISYTNLSYFYLAMQMSGRKSTNFNELEAKLISDVNTSLGTGDAACMQMQAITFMNNHEMFNMWKMNFIEDQKKTFTASGVDGYGYGANSCSTAQVIMTFAALGENIRDDKYQVDGKDMVMALLNYAEGYLFKYELSSQNTDKSFSTPQALASLMSYKLLRDLKKPGNIYA